MLWIQNKRGGGYSGHKKKKRKEKKRKDQGQILSGIHRTLQLIISSIEPSPVENNDHMSLELPQLIIIS